MEKGIHIRLEKKFPFFSIETLSDKFDKVSRASLDIPVENGWTATAVSWNSRNGVFAHVEFSKPGEPVQGARLKDGTLIDAVPVKEEDRSIWGGRGIVEQDNVAKKIMQAMQDRQNKGVKLTWNF